MEDDLALSYNISTRDDFDFYEGEYFKWVSSDETILTIHGLL